MKKTNKMNSNCMKVVDANLYPVLMKSPKSCLNFLHSLSSVCDKRFLLICLKRLGPNRKGRSELCWAP